MSTAMEIKSLKGLNVLSKSSRSGYGVAVNPKIISLSLKSFT
jgi:hypothetical protein